mgnify:CR=1 FL=1
MSNVENLNPQGAVSILSQLETALEKIIDDRIQAALEKINALSEDDVKDLVQSEVKNELDISEIPDLYGVRDIVSEEIDNIDWNDRVSESGALDGMITEDTLEGSLDEVVSDDYVKRDEFETALDSLSISRG